VSAIYEQIIEKHEKVIHLTIDLYISCP